MPEGGDGDDLMGMGMKGSLSPDSTEGERDGEVDRLEESGRGVRGLEGVQLRTNKAIKFTVRFFGTPKSIGIGR